MTLSVKSLAIVSALLWGGGVLFVGLVNLAAPSYGTAFLQCVSSVYPGFHNSRLSSTSWWAQGMPSSMEPSVERYLAGYTTSLAEVRAMLEGGEILFLSRV